MMRGIKYQAFISVAAIIFTSFFVVNVCAQDDETKIESGSSVFVFRRRNSESSSAFGRNSAKRTKSEKSDRRKKISNQVKEFSVRPNPVKPPRPVAPKPTPNKVEKVATGKKQSSKPKPSKPKSNVPTAEEKEELSETWVQRAEEALSKDKPGDAVTAYRVAIAYNPGNEEAKIGIISALIAVGDDLCDKEEYDKAISFYREVLRQEPQNIAATIGLANAYDGEEKNREAIIQYEKALQLNPELTEVFLPLGMIHLEINEYLKAEEYLNKALAVEQNKDEVYNLLGLSAFRQRRYSEALKHFTSAITANPNSGDAYQNLSEVYQRQGRTDDFLLHIQKSIALYSQNSPNSPRLSEAHTTLGRYFSANGKFEEAAISFQSAIKVNPKNIFAYRNLATLYGQKGRLDESVGVYRQMVMIEADFEPAEKAEIYGEYGLTALRAGLWEEAAKALEKAVALESDVADYVNLGSAYNKLAIVNKDKTYFTKAGGVLQKALALNGGLAQTHLNLGDSRLGEGNAEAALTCYREALKLKPKWAEAHKGAALALSELGKPSEALVEIKRAVDLEEKNPDMQFSLARIYLQSGNQKEAQKVLRTLQKLSPQRAGELENLMKNGNQPN